MIKLEHRTNFIVQQIARGVPKAQIARQCNIPYHMMYRFLKTLNKYHNPMGVGYMVNHCCVTFWKYGVIDGFNYLFDNFFLYIYLLHKGKYGSNSKLQGNFSQLSSYLNEALSLPLLKYDHKRPSDISLPSRLIYTYVRISAIFYSFFKTIRLGSSSLLSACPTASKAISATSFNRSSIPKT